MKEKLTLPFECFNINRHSNIIKEEHVNLISLSDMIGVLLCTEGSVEVVINGKRYAMSRGSLFFYTPSLFVRIVHISDDFKGKAIRTDYEYILLVVNRVLSIRNQLLIRENPCCLLTEKQFSDVEQLMDNLSLRVELENSEEVDALRKKIYIELVKSLGTTLCYEIVNIFFTNHPVEPLNAQDRKDEVVQNFIICLYKHYQSEREVKFYAAEQCLVTSYFSSIIKEKTGSSASRWIEKIVIGHAKQMLEYTDISIKELSTQLNFPTQSFFGKYFKQYVGISPKDYRKTKRE